MKELYKLRDMLCDELEKYGQRSEMTASTLDIVDKLAHSIKNIDKIIEAKTMEGNSNRSYGNHPSYGRSYDDGGNSMGYNSYGGRSRDSMGRYSGNEGNSLAAQIREVMPMMSRETQQEAQRLLTKLDQQGM